MDTPKEMSVAIDIDDRLTEMEEIQEAAIPKDSQSETNYGMTSKVKGELKTFVKKRLDELPGDDPDDDFYDPIGEQTIFRLPNHELKKELCEPKLVSIGPYHRGKLSLRTMEHQKWFMLRGFLKRNENVGYEVYLDAMKALEPRARLRYSEPVDLESDDFALMLLLDGCFVLEWLFGVENLDLLYNILKTGWNILDIFYDLCLMENQVPFNVIHTLFTIQDQGVGWSPHCKSEVVGQTCPLVELVNGIFEQLNQIQIIKFNPIDTAISCIKFSHLLSLYYSGLTYETTSTEQGKSPNFCQPDSFPCFKWFANVSSKPASDRTQQTQGDSAKPHNLFSSDCLPCSKLFPKSSKAASDSSQDAAYTHLKDVHIMCVSELCDAGVKFKKKKNPKHMLDISFEKGIIEIPFIKIDSHFVRMLWNLVAYEQADYDTYQSSLSSYLALMDSLINTEKDVAILERAGIVDNYFSNAQEAAVFFNQFNNFFFLNYDMHHFFYLFEKVKKYGESTWHKNRAKLVQDYFSNPWAFISVVAAVVLFALTVLQTYFSGKSV